MTEAPNPLRQALWPLSPLYGLVAAVRNGMFDAGWRRSSRLSVPVVSVGNLTVGGTGKTPTVLWLAQLAKEQGLRPGVLARGYGRERGAELNDEGTMLQARMPWLLQRQDPNRFAAGKQLVEDGADFIILDDGFQHRQLARDIDLVCLDAAMPFDNNQCLPAGNLREGRSGLRRADIALLTRADRLSSDQLRQRVDRVRQLAGNATLPVYACEHAAECVIRQPAGEQWPREALRGRRAWLLSAVARPSSFARSAAALGVDVAGERSFADHHSFKPAELDAAVAAARDADAILLTTEKDDARLQNSSIERYVLRVGLRFLGAAPMPAEVGLA